MLPFTHAQFIAVFAAYNVAAWPGQIVAYVVGLAICAAVWRPARGSASLVAGGLAAMWAWTGVVYHGLFFARINPAALAFAALFLVQGLLLALAASRGRLQFTPRGGPPARIALGWALVAYALVVYPLVGWLVGMSYPAMPTFGITPCPLTLFTLGILLLARTPPWWLAVIPVAWAMVGGSAAALLRVPQDWILLASALCLLPLWPRKAAAQP